MRKAPSIGEIRRRCQPRGLDVCFWRRLWVRRVSAWITWLFIALGVSANSVSALKGVIASAGALLFGAGEPLYAVPGALMLQFAFILDACDGEVARFHGSCARAGGEFLDKLGDVVSRGLFHAAWGFGLFRITGNLLYAALGAGIAGIWLAVRFCAVDTLLENLSSDPERKPGREEKEALKRLYVREPSSGRVEFILSTAYHPWANLAVLTAVSYFNGTAARYLFALYSAVWLLNAVRKTVTGYRISNFSRRDPCGE